jgi:polyhydroxyalkanoate synthesis regulator phasin
MNNEDTHEAASQKLADDLVRGGECEESSSVWFRAARILGDRIKKIQFDDEKITRQKGEITRLHDKIAKLKAELAETRGVAALVWRDGSGKPIGFRTTNHYMIGPGGDVCGVGVFAMGEDPDGDHESPPLFEVRDATGNEWCVHPDDLFSTLEAAQAAASGGGA